MSQVKFGTIQWEDLVQVGPVSLTTDVSGVLPVPNGGNGSGSYTNGQILIGNTTGNTLAKATLTGTANQVIVTNGASSITLSLPQSIATSSSPTFAALTVTSIASLTSTVIACSVPLSISKSYTDGGNGANILNVSATGNTITANTANILYGIQNDVRLNQASFNATSSQAITAAYNTASASGTSGTVTGVVANMGRAGNSSTAIVTTASVFYAMQALNFAGGTLTNWHGFYCEPSTAATNNYGFRGQIAAGTNRWNIYMDGTADNYIAGNLQLGLLVTKYNNISTAGAGIPAIYGQGRFTAQTAAKTPVASYTVGASDASFLISANVLVTTSTTHSFSVTCSYTDEGNTARTLTLTFSNVGGTLATLIANAGGTVPYEGIPLHIRAKASTTITIATTGTFTIVTYNVEGYITQIS